MPPSLTLVKKWRPLASVAAPSETGFGPTRRIAAAVSASGTPVRSSRAGTEYQLRPFIAPKNSVSRSAESVIGLTATFAGLPWNWIGRPPMTIRACGSACSAA